MHCVDDFKIVSKHLVLGYTPNITINQYKTSIDHLKSSRGQSLMCFDDTLQQ